MAASGSAAEALATFFFGGGYGGLGGFSASARTSPSSSGGGGHLTPTSPGRGGGGGGGGTTPQLTRAGTPPRARKGTKDAGHAKAAATAKELRIQTGRALPSPLLHGSSLSAANSPHLHGLKPHYTASRDGDGGGDGDGTDTAPKGLQQFRVGDIPAHNPHPPRGSARSGGGGGGRQGSGRSYARTSGTGSAGGSESPRPPASRASTPLQSPASTATPVWQRPAPVTVHPDALRQQLNDTGTAVSGSDRSLALSPGVGVAGVASGTPALQPPHTGASTGGGGLYVGALDTTAGGSAAAAGPASVNQAGVGRAGQPTPFELYFASLEKRFPSAFLHMNEEQLAAMAAQQAQGGPGVADPDVSAVTHAFGLLGGAAEPRSGVVRRHGGGGVHSGETAMEVDVAQAHEDAVRRLEEHRDLQEEVRQALLFRITPRAPPPDLAGDTDSDGDSLWDAQQMEAGMGGYNGGVSVGPGALGAMSVSGASAVTGVHHGDDGAGGRNGHGRRASRGARRRKRDHDKAAASGASNVTVKLATSGLSNAEVHLIRQLPVALRQQALEAAVAERARRGKGDSDGEFSKHIAAGKPIVRLGVHKTRRAYEDDSSTDGDSWSSSGSEVVVEYDHHGHLIPYRHRRRRHHKHRGPVDLAHPKQIKLKPTPVERMRTIQARIDSDEVAKQVAELDIQLLRPLLETCYWSDVLESRQDAVASLATLASNRHNLQALADNGALGAVLAVANPADRRNTPTGALDALRALSRMFALKLVRDRFCASPHGTDNTLRLLSWTGHSIKVGGLKTLQTLIRVDDDAKAHLVKRGAMAKLARIVTSQPDSLSSDVVVVRRLAIRLMRDLSSTRANIAVLGTAKFLSWCTDTLSSHPDLVVRRDLMQLLVNVASGDNNREACVQAGLLPALEAHFNIATPAELLHHAVHVLLLITVHPSNKAPVLATGILVPLLRSVFDEMYLAQPPPEVAKQLKALRSPRSKRDQRQRKASVYRDKLEEMWAPKSSQRRPKRRMRRRRKGAGKTGATTGGGGTGSGGGSGSGGGGSGRGGRDPREERGLVPAAQEAAAAVGMRYSGGVTSTGNGTAVAHAPVRPGTAHVGSTGTGAGSFGGRSGGGYGGGGTVARPVSATPARGRKLVASATPDGAAGARVTAGEPDTGNSGTPNARLEAGQGEFNAPAPVGTTGGSSATAAGVAEAASRPQRRRSRFRELTTGAGAAGARRRRASRGSASSASVNGAASVGGGSSQQSGEQASHHSGASGTRSGSGSGSAASGGGATMVVQYRRRQSVHDAPGDGAPEVLVSDADDDSAAGDHFDRSRHLRGTEAARSRARRSSRGSDASLAGPAAVVTHSSDSDSEDDVYSTSHHHHRSRRKSLQRSAEVREARTVLRQRRRASLKAGVPVPLPVRAASRGVDADGAGNGGGGGNGAGAADADAVGAADAATGVGGADGDDAAATPPAGTGTGTGTVTTAEAASRGAQRLGPPRSMLENPLRVSALAIFSVKVMQKVMGATRGVTPFSGAAGSAAGGSRGGGSGRKVDNLSLVRPDSFQHAPGTRPLAGGTGTPGHGGHTPLGTHLSAGSGRGSFRFRTGASNSPGPRTTNAAQLRAQTSRAQREGGPDWQTGPWGLTGQRGARANGASGGGGGGAGTPRSPRVAAAGGSARSATSTVTANAPAVGPGGALAGASAGPASRKARGAAPMYRIRRLSMPTIASDPTTDFASPRLSKAGAPLVTARASGSPDTGVAGSLRGGGGSGSSADDGGPATAMDLAARGAPSRGAQAQPAPATIEEDMVHMTLALVSSLAADASLRDALVFDSPVLHFVLRDDVYKSRDKKVRRPVATILRYLAEAGGDESPRHAALIVHNAIPVLVSFLCSDDISLKHDSVFTLADLAVTSTTRMSICIPRILAAVFPMGYSADPHLTEAASRIIAELADDAVCEILLARAGALKPLSHMLGTRSGRECRLNAVRAIANLSSNEEVQPMIVESGCVGMLLHMAKHDIGMGKVFAQAAMDNVRFDAAAVLVQNLIRGWLARRRVRKARRRKQRRELRRQRRFRKRKRAKLRTLGLHVSSSESEGDSEGRVEGEAAAHAGGGTRGAVKDSLVAGAHVVSSGSSGSSSESAGE